MTRLWINDDRPHDGWTLADGETGECVSFETREQARAALRFAKEYVARHGGINLDGFPYSIDDPFAPNPRDETP
jgi:hypothetical protein